MENDAKTDRVLRWIAGEPLSNADQKLLLADLQASQDRNPALANDRVDALLRGLAWLPPSQDSFLQKTLARIDQANRPSHAEGASPRPIASAASPPVGTNPVQAASAKLAVAPRRREKSQTLWKKSALAAAMAASLVIGFGLQQLWSGKTSPDQPSIQNVTVNPVRQPQPTPETPLKHPELISFASLANSDQAEWDAPHRIGDKFGQGPVKLLRGTAELQFDQGAVVNVTGPAEFDLQNPKELVMQRGRIQAHVPVQAIGFTVTTPVGRVVDLGTDFDVDVGEQGQVEALVRQGKIRVFPQRPGEKAAKAVDLTSGGFDRATISLPDIKAPVVPVSTVFHDRQGHFRGMVSVNGNTVEVNSPEEFQTLQKSLLQQMQDSPTTFSQQWSMSVHSSGAGTATTSVVINGRPYTFEAPAEDQHLQFSGQGGTTEVPLGVPNAKQKVRNRLEEIRREHADNPAMQELLEKMQKQLDSM